MNTTFYSFYCTIPKVVFSLRAGGPRGGHLPGPHRVHHHRHHLSPQDAHHLPAEQVSQAQDQDGIGEHGVHNVQRVPGRDVLPHAGVRPPLQPQPEQVQAHAHQYPRPAPATRIRIQVQSITFLRNRNFAFFMKGDFYRRLALTQLQRVKLLDPKTFIEHEF